jgi:hypothetical protein
LIAAKDSPSRVVSIEQASNATRDVNFTVLRSTIDVAPVTNDAYELVYVGSPQPVVNCSECRFPTAEALVVVEASVLTKVGNIVSGEVQKSNVRVHGSVLYGALMQGRHSGDSPQNPAFLHLLRQSRVDIQDVVFAGTRLAQLASLGTLTVTNVTAASASITLHAAAIVADNVRVTSGTSLFVTLVAGFSIPTLSLSNVAINVTSRSLNTVPAVELHVPDTSEAELTNVSATAPSLLQVSSHGPADGTNVTLQCCQLNGVRVTSPAALWPKATIGTCDWTAAPPATTTAVTTPPPTPAPFATLPPPTPGPTPVNTPPVPPTATPASTTTTATSSPSATTTSAGAAPSTTTTHAPTTASPTGTPTSAVPTTTTATSSLPGTTAATTTAAPGTTLDPTAASSTTTQEATAPPGTAQPATTQPPALTALRVAGLRQPPQAWVAGALASVTDVEGVRFVSSQVAANGDLWVVVTVPAVANSSFVTAVTQQAALLGVTEIQAGTAPPDDTSQAEGPSVPAAPTAADDDGTVIIAVAAAAASVVAVAAAAGAYVVLQKKSPGASPHEPLQDELLVMPSSSV